MLTIQLPKKSKAIKTISFSLLLAVSLFLLSCEDFYMPPKNEFPGAEATSSTLNLELIINGAYSPIGNYHSSDHMIMSELLGGPSLIYSNGTSNLDYIQIRNFDLSETTGITGDIWYVCYESANNANVIIETIENTTEPLDNFYDSQKDRLLGEAKFIRALSYFNLVKLFGHQYSDNNSGLGIILRTNATTGAREELGDRSTVQDAYDLILSDLKEATVLLPLQFSQEEQGNFLPYRYRATKKAAYALLAKVYFQMNDFENTLAMINAVLGDVPGDITGNDTITGTNPPVLANDVVELYSVEGKGTPKSECLFFIYNAEPNLDYSTDIRYKTYNDPSSRYQGVFHHSQDFVDLFNAEGYYVDTLDQRYTEQIQDIVYDGDSLMHSAKFGYKHGDPNNPGSSVSTFLNIPVIRSAELLLMRAEINVLNGEIFYALDDLNLILARAGNEPIEGPVRSSKLFELILQERIKEMSLEGDYFHNWKRMGAYNSLYGPTYPESWLGYMPFDRDGKSFEWNSQETLAKIPKDEMDRNPNVAGQQN